MKFYLDIPSLDPHSFQNFWRRSLPLNAGVYISWDRYDFDLCSSKGYFPRGPKKGKTCFRVVVGLLGMSACFNFYKPSV